MTQKVSSVRVFVSSLLGALFALLICIITFTEGTLFGMKAGFNRGIIGVVLVLLGAILGGFIGFAFKKNIESQNESSETLPNFFLAIILAVIIFTFMIIGGFFSTGGMH